MTTHLVPTAPGFGARAEVIIVGLLFFLLLWGLHTLGCTDAGTEFNQFLLRQLQWSLIGIAVMIISAAIPFRYWQRYAVHLCLTALLLVAAVTFYGKAINGMQGWFQFGTILLQPSEIAKPLFLLFLVCTGNRTDRPGWMVQAPRFIVFVLFALLLARQPDFGTLLIYLSMLLIVFWISGVSVLWLATPFACGLMAALYAIWKIPYVYRRLDAFLNPLSDLFGHGWHIAQLRIALAHGGLNGAADGQALWSSAQLPLSHSDSAFAALCEATGMAGGIMVLAAIGGIVLTGYYSFRNGRGNTAGKFILAGTALFAVQSLLHISVNLTVFPITGLTLPFISYGGSSLTAYMLLFGIIFSAMRRQRQEAPTPPAAT